ncbi:MAG: DUF6850 family outer membrane beta-barrel protein [Candidatus Neomarinimicrobiota bacterium]
MNKIFSKTLILSFSLLLGLFAFEDVFTSRLNFSKIGNSKNNSYYLTGDPASFQFDGNLEMISTGFNYSDKAFKRTYDPTVIQNINASYYTLRQIDNKSFFAAGLAYEDLRLKDMWGSREKDFYDDYFSTADSSAGKTAYYGPRLQFMYNAELSKDLFFGLLIDYGVERGLKDTFPQTITIMRNSSYKMGLDYRKEKFGIGLHARYYDDQTHYESVKFFVEVEAKTFMGYHVFYNENSSSRSRKKRVRNGLEAGGHLRVGRVDENVVNIAASFLHRSSTSEVYTSYSKPRGYWERQGLHIKTDFSSYSIDKISLKLYGEYLTYNDWGKSLISNTLILENKESYFTAGANIQYKPSLINKYWLGGGIGHVAYDYIEYLYPFQDKRSGIEWNAYAGAEMMFSSKLNSGIRLHYEKTVPKFYWNTEYFQNIGLGIMLEHLFSFGYIGANFDFIKQNPSDSEDFNRKYQIILTFRRK